MINAAPISEFRDEDGQVSKFQIAEGAGILSCGIWRSERWSKNCHWSSYLE